MKDKEDIQKKFGKHLKRLRQEMNVTSAELSRRTFIEKPHITRLEKGDSNPTLYTLTKIADALKISMDELFKGYKH